MSDTPISDSGGASGGDDGSPPVQLSPLSIQAASLVRSIEGLSNIFWISLGGTFLTIFFAGLSQLDTNATTDYIYLGEYQVPRSILPLASLAFALFTYPCTYILFTLSIVPPTQRIPRPQLPVPNSPSPTPPFHAPVPVTHFI